MCPRLTAGAECAIIRKVHRRVSNTFEVVSRIRWQVKSLLSYPALFFLMEEI